MESIIQLDKQLLLFLNGSDCLWLDNLMWYVSRTGTWAFMMLALLFLVVRRDNWRATGFFILGFVLCIVLADQISSSIIKPLVMRPRPTHDPVIGSMVDVVRGHRGGHFGFVSSHAANTFAVVTFLTLIVRRRALAWVTFSWAALVSWSRIYLGVHYPGDVLCGALLGCFVGWVLSRLYHLVTVYPPLDEETHSRLTATGFSLFRLRCFYASVFLTYLVLIVVSFF